MTDLNKDHNLTEYLFLQRNFAALTNAINACWHDLALPLLKIGQAINTNLNTIEEFEAEFDTLRKMLKRLVDVNQKLQQETNLKPVDLNGTLHNALKIISLSKKTNLQLKNIPKIIGDPNMITTAFVAILQYIQMQTDNLNIPATIISSINEQTKMIDIDIVCSGNDKTFIRNEKWHHPFRYIDDTDLDINLLATKQLITHTDGKLILLLNSDCKPQIKLSFPIPKPLE